MASDPDEFNASAWLLLCVARALVAGHTASDAAAETLLLLYLADGRIRWRFLRQVGEWQPLDPSVGHSPDFWRAEPPYALTIDWQASSATRTGPANNLITARGGASQPGTRRLSAAQYEFLRAQMLRGELPATNYTVDLIRLHRGDVMDALRSAGFDTTAAAAPAPVTVEPAPAAAVPAAKVPAKRWLAKAEAENPQRPDEGITDYARRLEPLMADDPAVTKKWTWENIRRRLYDKDRD